MIKIEAKAEILDKLGEEAGINISNETSGTAKEILHESLAVVRSVTSVLRKNNPFVLMMFLEAIKNDHDILLGEEPTKEETEESVTKSAESVLADIMSEGIIGKEMN